MTLTGIYGPCGFYKTTSISAPKVSASEEGLFKPITAKVSGALSDEYIDKIRAQARADAAKGSYMDGYDKKQRTGFSAMRDAQMKRYVSPSREKATSEMSSVISSRNFFLRPGENLLDLLSIPYRATICKGALFGTTSEIYNEDGEMIAGYRDSCGWFDVPTKDETRFQYESNQIYREAYRAAEAEIAAGKQAAAPAVSGDASVSFDVKV